MRAQDGGQIGGKSVPLNLYKEGNSPHPINSSFW